MYQVWVPPSLCEGGCGVRSTVSGESVSQGAATPRGLPGSRTRFHISSAHAWRTDAEFGALGHRTHLVRVRCSGVAFLVAALRGLVWLPCGAFD